MVKKVLWAWVAVGVSLLVGVAGASPAAAAVDIYVTPGTHYVNGRVWRTTCAAYSSTIDRCRTEIKSGSVFVFNNLTYKASPRLAWAGNPLGQTATWTSNGRSWRTECDTAVTGYNGCRSYIKSANGSWVFNNMVRFSNDSYLTVSGVGDDVLSIPTGIGSGLVQSQHSGTSNFIVETLTSTNQLDDVVVNEIGDYSGTGAFGVSAPSQARKLQVTADGAWSITVKPLSAAPKFSGSVSGSTDTVLWYTGPAATVRLAHSGESNFIVTSDSDAYGWDLLANEIGAYSGTTTIQPGPAVVQVDADGPWTVQRVG